jgi:hypothetical protein
LVSRNTDVDPLAVMMMPLLVVPLSQFCTALVASTIKKEFTVVALIVPIKAAGTGALV